MIACEKRPVPPKTENQIPIARLDDRIFYGTELDELVKRLQDRTPIVFQSFPQKRQLIEQWINVELLYQAALKAKMQDRFEFKSRMADVYVEELAAQARNKLSEKEIKAEYLAHPQDYDQISVRHIMFALPNGKKSSEKERDEKLQRAKSVREQLMIDSDKFAAFARQYSDDRSGRQGGELGFFSYRQMDPEFSRAAFALKHLKDISPIVRTDAGYHLIQLTGDRRGFEHHRENIRAQLIRRVQRDMLDNEIKKLRAEHRLEFYDENISKLSPLPEKILEGTNK